MAELGEGQRRDGGVEGLDAGGGEAAGGPGGRERVVVAGLRRSWRFG